MEELEEETVVASTTFSGILSSPSALVTMEFPDGTIQNAGDLKIDYDNNGTVDIVLSPNIGEEVTLDEPSLSVLLAILKQKIQGLDIKANIKNNLVKKIENLEKKIEKKKEKNIKILTKLEQNIIKKQIKNKIDSISAEEILTILENIEAQVEELALDEELLTILKEKINLLPIKNNQKTSLLKRVENLENRKALTKILSNVTANIIKKGEQGIINDTDIEIILELLNNIEKHI